MTTETLTGTADSLYTPLITKELRAFMDETWASIRKTSAEIEKTKDAIEKSREKDAIAMAELRDELNKWVGYFGNNIGYIVEAVLIPGIKPKMNELGHAFTSMSSRKKYFKKEGRAYTEVDLCLENGEEVMIVEVKTQLSKKDVEYQLKRLKLLRENESETSLKGKVLYSAVAGMEIDEDAREMAFEHGMYVVEMVENTKHVNVITPPSGKIGTW